MRCQECDGTELSWQSMVVSRRSRNFVPWDRTMFFLGCDECSATVITEISAEDVAEVLNKYGWRPGDADR